jgi:hypothetical protein
MPTVNQADLVSAKSVDELSALASNPALTDLLFYVRDGSQTAENDKHRKVAGTTLRSLMGLRNASGSDSAVSLVANQEYDVEGSVFTANRTYSLPAASKGDRVRINFASAHATHALIMAGASGVTINGGSAATEWSRLIIAKEWAEFRATSSSNWDVYNDGRIAQVGMLEATSSTSVSANTWTQVFFNTQVSNSNSASHANDRLTARRAGNYNFSALWVSGTSTSASILAMTRNGPTTSPDRRFASTIFAGSSSGIGPVIGGAYAVQAVPASAGDTFELLIFVADVSATALSTVPYLPRFAFTEVL